VLTYFLNGKEIPFATKAELEKQMPFFKKKFFYAKDFAEASLQDIFTESKLRESKLFTADYFSNAILINDGKLHFAVEALPPDAQFTPYRDGVVLDANSDSLPDILLVGNYYENNVELGRNDADFGTLLINHGNNKFSCETLNGLNIIGQSRHIKKITIAREEAFVIARNNDSAIVITFKKNNEN
jgi:hypothetical protein